MEKVRIEHDLLGEKEVPIDAYYGIQTVRAIDNFHITGVPISQYPELIRALAMIKLAAARANHDCDNLRDEILRGIEGSDCRIVSGTAEICSIGRRNGFFTGILVFTGLVLASLWTADSCHNTGLLGFQQTGPSLAAAGQRISAESRCCGRNSGDPLLAVEGLPGGAQVKLRGISTAGSSLLAAFQR